MKQGLIVDANLVKIQSLVDDMCLPAYRIPYKIVSSFTVDQFKSWIKLDMLICLKDWPLEFYVR